MNVKWFLVLCFFIAATKPLQGREWNGIVPLRSTRTEVEKRLGLPAGVSSQYAAKYKTQKETVYILYASGGPCGPDGPDAWQVPRGTVISITVQPNKEVRFSDLHLDESKYKKTDNQGHGPAYFYYTDEEEGIQYEVTLGIVISIIYFPSAKDAQLRCCISRPGPTSAESRWI